MVPGWKENQSACNESSELLPLFLRGVLTVGQWKHPALKFLLPNQRPHLCIHNQGSQI